MRNNIRWKSGVYFLRFDQNPRLYIGATQDSFFSRAANHISLAGRGKHHNREFQALFDQHGVAALGCYILDVASNRRELICKEDCWFRILEPQDLVINKQRKGGTGIRKRSVNLAAGREICQLRHPNGRRFISVAISLDDFKHKQLEKLAAGAHHNERLQGDFNIGFIPEFEKLGECIYSESRRRFWECRERLTEDDYSSPHSFSRFELADKESLIVD
jgi:hypothetical protein